MARSGWSHRPVPEPASDRALLGLGLVGLVRRFELIGTARRSAAPPRISGFSSAPWRNPLSSLSRRSRVRISSSPCCDRFPSPSCVLVRHGRLHAAVRARAVEQATRRARPRAFDLVIANGRIVDGTGAPWFRGDIGIIGDRIEAIGNLQRGAGADAHRRRPTWWSRPGSSICSGSPSSTCSSIRAPPARSCRASPPRSPARAARSRR